jgi:hypothetical protein
MGLPYYKPLTHWGRGEWNGAMVNGNPNYRQDDLAVMSTMVPLVKDEVGDTIATAKALALGEQRLACAPGRGGRKQPLGVTCAPLRRRCPAGASFSGLLGYNDPADVFTFGVPTSTSVRASHGILLPPRARASLGTAPRAAKEGGCAARCSRRGAPLLARRALILSIRTCRTSGDHPRAGDAAFKGSLPLERLQPRQPGPAAAAAGRPGQGAGIGGPTCQCSRRQQHHCRARRVPQGVHTWARPVLRVGLACRLGRPQDK